VCRFYFRVCVQKHPLFSDHLKKLTHRKWRTEIIAVNIDLHLVYHRLQLDDAFDSRCYICILVYTLGEGSTHHLFSILVVFSLPHFLSLATLAMFVE
jgi:hypothetical protein